MAQISERLTQNAPGDFFVDASCIDCDACRQIAPAVFGDHGGQSSVYHQPQNPGELHRALMALVAIELLSLIFLKVVIILLGALLFATGPI